jgi:hypothetical protein
VRVTAAPPSFDAGEIRDAIERARRVGGPGISSCVASRQGKRLGIAVVILSTDEVEAMLLAAAQRGEAA